MAGKCSQIKVESAGLKELYGFPFEMPHSKFTLNVYKTGELLTADQMLQVLLVALCTSFGKGVRTNAFTIVLPNVTGSSWLAAM